MQTLAQMPSRNTIVEFTKVKATIANTMLATAVLNVRV